MCIYMLFWVEIECPKCPICYKYTAAPVSQVFE